MAGNWDWELLFNVMGGLCFIWTVLWIWPGQDTPCNQSLIRAEAGSIFALFFYAFLARIWTNFGWYMLLKRVLELNFKENAIATSVHLWTFSMAISKTLDCLEKKGKITFC